MVRQALKSLAYFLLCLALGFIILVVGSRWLDHPVTNTGIAIVFSAAVVGVLIEWGLSVIRGALDEVANLDFGRVTP